MKVLELFSGTGSVGKCCKELGWDVVSVDMILPADHQVDIMDFDYKQYSKDEFDIVWGSPPCQSYSNLQNSWKGRMRNGKIFTQDDIDNMMNEADQLVLKTFEIIDYFKPELWFVENPATGRLKNRDIMKDKPFYDVSYCMYSDWGYEKKTRIWTNKKDWNNLICDKSGACGNMIEIATDGAVHSGYKTPIKSATRKIHTNVIGDGNKLKALKKHKVDVSLIGCGSQHNQSKDLKFLGKGTNRIDRYRIPEDLIYSLFLD